MKESNTRLHAVQASSVDLKSEDFGAIALPQETEYGKPKQADSISQSSVVENIQHFETVREPHKSMVRLIDTMFDYLQLYADESNKDNTDPHLNLHWQRPTLEKLKNTKSWLTPIPQLPTFTGKLYTCDWSLIVKGTHELVTSYVIPSDRVISFNSEPEIYSPYLTINCVKKNANFNWQIDNEIITHEHIDDLSQRLLERLMKSARSQEWSQSVFCLDPVAGDLANSEDKELEISKNLNETASDPEQFLVDLMKTASEQAKPKTDEFKIVPELSIQSESIGINPDKLKVDVSLPMQPEMASINANGKLESTLGVQTFEEALISLPNILVQKLEQLTKEGGDAFSRRDLKGAQDILTLSNQLNEFKAMAEEIMTAFKIQR